MPPSSDEPWTTRRLLEWIAGAFEQRGLDAPRLSAEILVSHVLGCERLRLYMDPDRPAAADERDRLRDLVKRALGHEPIQYLTGEAWFFGLPFKADRRALIPRPSTETLVEHVLQHAQRAGRSHEHGGARPGETLRPIRAIADVCTGSGCVAVALAKHLPEARVVATDISGEALGLAAENAERHGVSERVEFVEGDLLEPLAGRDGAFDVIVSNPPYIPDDEWGAVEPNVKDHEPHGALRGGSDGHDLIRPLIAGAPRLLAEGGWLVIETSSARAGLTRSLLEGQGMLANAVVLQDHDGLDRVAAAQRVGTAES